MVPKGRRERADFFIDEDTKNVLTEVVKFQRHVTGERKLPWYGTTRHAIHPIVICCSGTASDSIKDPEYCTAFLASWRHP